MADRHYRFLLYLEFCRHFSYSSRTLVGQIGLIPVTTFSDGSTLNLHCQTYSANNWKNDAVDRIILVIHMYIFMYCKRCDDSKTCNMLDKKGDDVKFKSA